MKKYTFIPETYKAWQDKSLGKNLSKDLFAGIITGIIALPLAIAFAIASGASPEQGLFSAIIGGFIISLLSGSRVQIGGPTGAFIVVVYSIIHTYGMSGLILANIMAGLILILFGVLRFGSIIKFIPYPVTQGFTSGIAVLIAITQLNDFLGLSIPKIPSSVIERLGIYISSFTTLNTTALSIGVGTIITVLAIKRIQPKLPSSIFAVLIFSSLTYYLHLDIETIGSKFGTIDNSFPSISLPTFDFDLILKLFPSALTIALLGAIESLLSAVVADGMTGIHHHSNTELVAQGVSNIITPLFGGIPTTGAIARTATNIQNGGKTPLAGIFHAVTLLFFVIFLASYAALIPLALLSAILLLVAVAMSEYKLFFKMFRAPKSDIAVMLLTFILTIFIDLTVAIPTGVVLASLLFMGRMERVACSEVTYPENNLDKEESTDDPFAIGNYQIPESTCVYEINGPFFFGAAKRFQYEALQQTPRVLILRMRHVNAIDATGIFALEDIITTSNSNNCTVLISGIRPQPLGAINKTGIVEKLGSKKIFPNIATALSFASELVNK